MARGQGLTASHLSPSASIVTYLPPSLTPPPPRPPGPPGSSRIIFFSPDPRFSYKVSFAIETFRSQPNRLQSGCPRDILPTTISKECSRSVTSSPIKPTICTVQPSYYMSAKALGLLILSAHLVWHGCKLFSTASLNTNSLMRSVLLLSAFSRRGKQGHRGAKNLPWSLGPEVVDRSPAV